MPDQDSQEYHAAHLAFARSTIVETAAKNRPILDLLTTYTGKCPHGMCARYDMANGE